VVAVVRRSILFCLALAAILNSSAGPLDVWQWRNPLPTGNTLSGIVLAHSTLKKMKKLHTRLIVGCRLDLTNGERTVLVELARAYPGLTMRTALDRRPENEHEVSSNVTEVLVTRLRRKIAAAGGGVEIHAVRRSGYVLRAVTMTADLHA